MEKQRVGERQQLREQQQQVVSVFVENLPKVLHWKGLWHGFARHGDVTDTSIAKKRSKGFGFVKMRNRSDALRVIERMACHWEDGESSSENRVRWKRISGHVEEEELWKLERCLVGEMASVCSVQNGVKFVQVGTLGNYQATRGGVEATITSEMAYQGGLHYSVLPRDANYLEVPVSIEEVKEAIWSCVDSKASGHDGCNMMFYKHCWEEIKGDLMRLMTNFYATGALVENCLRDQGGLAMRGGDKFE
ncbi:hypothetical protein V6N13_132242 [Hibiscus sabdariffa]